MSSESSPDVPTEENTTVKPKRLPRSAKKRLRYERLRQHFKEAPKKKKNRPRFQHPAASELLSDSHDGKVRLFNKKFVFFNAFFSYSDKQSRSITLWKTA